MVRRRLAVELVVAHAVEETGQVPVGLVVLRADALALRRAGSRTVARGGQADGEVAQLVLGHQQREAQALFVVHAPGPRSVHGRVREPNARPDEVLDRLRHGPRPG